MPLALLVEDWDVYPRHDVDSSHVNRLYETLTAGVTLPPPLVDARTKRIVDGFHRTRAQRKFLGDDGSIKVELRSYPSELALLEDAVRFNAAHGRRLDSQDLTRSTILLRRLGAETVSIAATLSITETKVEQISARVVIVKSGNKTEKRAAKPSMWPRKNEQPHSISHSQYEVHQSSNGWRHRQTIKQLTKELSCGLVDLDTETIEALKGLRDAITAVVP